MRSAILVLLVLLVPLVPACGSSKTPAEPAPAPAAVAALPAMPPCEPRMDIPDGLHDRYSFTEGPDEKFGFKTKAGQVVIPAQYHHAYPFTPGGVAAIIDGVTPFIFIDTSGKVIGKAYAYDNGPDYYQEGFARIVGSDGKIGYISESTGRIEIPIQFDQASSFCEGKADVEVGGEKYSIDKTGKRLP